MGGGRVTALIPYCSRCGYRGDPGQDITTCPRDGARMNPTTPAAADHADDLAVLAERERRHWGDITDMRLDPDA